MVPSHAFLAGGADMQSVADQIRTMASRKLLANPQGSRDIGTVVIQRQDTGETDQEWSFEPPLDRWRQSNRVRRPGRGVLTRMERTMGLDMLGQLWAADNAAMAVKKMMSGR